MLQAAFFMLRDGVEYRDLGSDHFDRRDKTKAIDGSFDVWVTSAAR